MFEARSRKQLWMIVLMLAALVVVFAPSTEAGEKLVVKMEEPFEVAGTIYPSGKLSVREVRDYSPVAQLHEIRVDGKSLGLMRANLDASPPAKRDVVTFKRSGAGHLVLVAVALQGQPTHSYAETRF